MEKRAKLGKMVKWTLKHNKTEIKISEIKGELSLNELSRVADKYHLADIIIGKKKLTLVTLDEDVDESLIKAADVPELKGETVLKEATCVMSEIDDDELFAIREEDSDFDFSEKDEIIEPKKPKKKKRKNKR